MKPDLDICINKCPHCVGGDVVFYCRMSKNSSFGIMGAAMMARRNNNKELTLFALFEVPESCPYSIEHLYEQEKVAKVEVKF